MNRDAAKYKSFDALRGHKEEIERVANNRLKIERPILSEDDIENINYHLMENNNQEKYIEYYYNGERLDVTGVITSINVESKLIKIDNKLKLSMYDILKIENL